MPEFPPPNPDDEIVGNQVRMRRALWAKLKRIGAEQQPRRSMNEVIVFFLEWATEDYELARSRKKK